jgi:hypothetical protein
VDAHCATTDEEASVGLKDLLGGGGDGDGEAKDSQSTFGEPLVDPSDLNVAGGGTVSNMTNAGPDADPDDGAARGGTEPGRAAERDNDL